MRAVTMLLALLLGVAATAHADPPAPDAEPGVAPAAPVAQPAVRYVPVAVEGSEDYTLATLGYQGCRLPCTLFVAPGVHPLILTGKRDFITNVEIPPSQQMVVNVSAPSPALKIA